MQARDKLRNFGVSAGIIKAGRDKDARPQASVQVAGIQTLHARAIRAETMEMPPADIVFIDEAHHVPAMTYQAILARYPDAIIIGLTATPCRGDGRGLGNTFESMIQGPQIARADRARHLVQAEDIRASRRRTCAASKFSDRRLRHRRSVAQDEYRRAGRRSR